GRGHAVRLLRRHLLLAAEVVGTHVRREAGAWALLAVVALLQRDVLPDALRRPRRHAEAHSGLRAAVHRLEHGLDRRRVRVRTFATALLLHRREMYPQR